MRSGCAALKADTLRVSAGRMRSGAAQGAQCARASSVLDESVDVVLRAVLARRHLEHEGDAQQRLLSIAIRHHLQRRQHRHVTNILTLCVCVCVCVLPCTVLVAFCAAIEERVSSMR